MNFNPVRLLPPFWKFGPRPPPQAKRGGVYIMTWPLSYNYWPNGKYVFAALHTAIQTFSAKQQNTDCTNMILSFFEPPCPQILTWGPHQVLKSTCPPPPLFSILWETQFSNVSLKPKQLQNTKIYIFTSVRFGKFQH